jgi:hypothetical protein
MVVSGQRHAPAALQPWGKDTRYPFYRRLGGPQSRCDVNYAAVNKYIDGENKEYIILFYLYTHELLRNFV